MFKNKDILLNKLEDNRFIEIYKLEDIEKETLFDNYQRYDFYQLIWFTRVKGNTTYFLDFKEHTIRDNDIILVFPGQIDRLDIEGKEGFLYAISNDAFYSISQHINSDYLNGYYHNIFISVKEEKKEVLQKLNELILTEYEKENRLPLLKSYMESFLFHISSAFDESYRSTASPDNNIPALMRLIDKYFIEEKETDFYACNLGMSIKTINEMCKKGTGKTVKQHLQERLILEIKKEIRLGENNLKEISFKLGFSEPAYFTRFFKKHTGETPTEFRDT